MCVVNGFCFFHLLHIFLAWAVHKVPRRTAAAAFDFGGPRNPSLRGHTDRSSFGRTDLLVQAGPEDRQAAV